MTDRTFAIETSGSDETRTAVGISRTGCRLVTSFCFTATGAGKTTFAQALLLASESRA